MGINIILPLIMGIAMTVILGSQVAPSYIEKMKVAKVENRTIANQNLIKDAIVRYIKIKGEVPDYKKGLEDLEKAELIQKHHKDNFFKDEYSFYIDKKLGTLKIFTTINDDVAGKYFSNSFKFPNAPTCKQALDINGVCVSGEFETFYLLDEETFKSIPVPEVGSIEWIEDKYSKENLGDRYEEKEIPLVGGEIDYVVDVPNNKVIEYIYDIDKKEWVESGTSFGGNFINDPIPNIIEFAEKYPNLNNYIKNLTNFPYLSGGNSFAGPRRFLIRDSDFNNNTLVTKELVEFIIQERYFFMDKHPNYYPELYDADFYPTTSSFKVVKEYYSPTVEVDFGANQCDGSKYIRSRTNSTNQNIYVFYLYPCENNNEEKYHSDKITYFFKDFNNQINIAPLFKNP